MHRRGFIEKGLKAASFAALSSKGRAESDAGRSAIDLIPLVPAQCPNYWCTWATQNYMYGHDLQHLDPKILEGASGSLLAHNALNESSVFGPNGWAVKFFPDIRRDLYFLFDDGWASGGSATFILDTEKFPSFSGSPEAGLQKLNAAILDKGWRGAALWCRSTPAGSSDIPLVERSRDAGIGYWKIDGGDKEFDVDRARDQLHASLTTEHVYGEEPLNGDWHKDGRFGVQQWDSPRLEILKRSDVYRTYDTTPTLSIATTLDRASQLLNAVQGHPETHALLNVEDEVYLAAVLGCTMGIMRFPLSGLRPDGDVDIGFSGPRNAKRRMDEVVRSIHWQRIAAPYSAGTGFVRLDSEILTDSWTFQRGETWYTDAIGQLVKHGAPARVSRNIELPTVDTADPSREKPYVCAARFPNGSIAIATLERAQEHNAWFMPKVVVSLDLDDAEGYIGIFGQFETLNLTFAHSLQSKRVLAQDLKGGHAFDITKKVEIRGKNLRIPGSLISLIGLHEGSPGDQSDPGMVLKFM